MIQAYKGVTYNDAEIEKLSEIYTDDIDLNNQIRHEYVGLWKSESQNSLENMSAFIFNSKEVIFNKELNIVNWDYDKKTGKFVIEVN